MASFTLSRSDVFPVGTVVNVYPAAAARANEPARGAAVDSGTVGAGGSVTFNSLVADTPYVAHAGAGFGAVRFRVSSSTADLGLGSGTMVTTSGSKTVTVTVAAGVVVEGQRFTGPGIPVGTFVDTVSGSTVVLTEKATASASGVAFEASGGKSWRSKARARRAAIGTA